MAESPIAAPKVVVIAIEAMQGQTWRSAPSQLLKLEVTLSSQLRRAGGGSGVPLQSLKSLSLSSRLCRAGHGKVAKVKPAS